MKRIVISALCLLVGCTAGPAGKDIGKTPSAARRTMKVTYKGLWHLAGTVEELRSRGVAIPPEAEEIVRESLVRINIPWYMKDVFPGKRARLIELLEGLDVPASVPNVYGEHPELFTKQPVLPPFETKRFFEDKVLGVGLKSYPMVLDFNGNGKKDLLVGDHDGFIYVYLNQGTDAEPVFGRGERLRAADTGEPLIVQANPKMSFGDLQRNGRLDMVLGNYAGRVAYLPSRSDSLPPAYAMKDCQFLRMKDGYVDVGNYAYPELIDWNGNGFLDLVVGNVDGKLYLFRNSGQTNRVEFEPGVEIPGIETLMYPHPVFVDWNNNGKKDLVLGHRDGTIIVYLNVGTETEPRFERHGPARHADGRPVHIGLLSHPAFVDWNNDGKKDLVVGNDPGQVIVFLNVGTAEEPVFDAGRRLMDGGGELIMGVHSVFSMADLNADGRPDLIVGHQKTRLRIFENVGTPAEPAFDDFAEIEGIEVTREALADKETERFWDLPGLDFDREYLGNLAPCPVDWDNSGTLDLLIGNYSGLIYLFKNVGTPQKAKFVKAGLIRVGDQPLRVAGFSTPVVCDWNNDGRKDLVVGDLLGRVHVFLNTGTDAEPEFSDDMLVTVRGTPVALAPRSIVEVADINADGKKDVLVGNRFGGVYALVNTGTDAEPKFDAIEQLRDKSMMWRQLYAGRQHSPHKHLQAFYHRQPLPDSPQPMNVVETSCPRVLDYNSDGRGELLISHRYGRVFDYGTLPASGE